METSLLDERNKEIVVNFVLFRFKKCVTVLKDLPSFDDTNVLLQEVKESCLSGSIPHKFVIKILEDDLVDDVALERKMECMKFLASNNFECSHFILGVDGNYIQKFSYGDFEGSLKKSAVLYSYLHGSELEYTGYVRYPNVISELGSFLALFHGQLQDIPHLDKEDLQPEPENPWSLENYELLLRDDCLGLVKDDSKKKILSSILEKATPVLNSSRSSLTKGIVHGDFQGLNIIVGPSYSASVRQSCSPFCISPTHTPQDKSHHEEMVKDFYQCKSESPHSCFSHFTADFLPQLALRLKSNQKWCALCKQLPCVYGVIDFEDISYSYTALEIGRLVADVMVTYLVNYQTEHHLSTSLEDSCSIKRFFNDMPEASKDHLLRIGGYVLAGYCPTKVLSEADLRCVYPAMLTALCQYHLLGLQAASYEPKSTAYVSYCSDEAFALLQHFQHIAAHDATHMWLNVVQEMCAQL